MPTLGLETEIVDRQVFDNSVRGFQESQTLLPTFSQLASPHTIPEPIRTRLAEVDPDEPHPLNLFRVHWFNPLSDGVFRQVPEHVELPSSLTGVEARIVVLLADLFPMIHAHKVLASYGCLIPRLMTGQFDPLTNRAVWPSTGNYCRGGVAVSRISGCRGVAVLPEGMSQERFDWLERWVADPEDIVRTKGTESNVKEIYDKCAELAEDPQNVIFNQFSEFGNYLVHHECTGPAVGRMFDHLAGPTPGLKLRAWVSATGSAGTLAAGDYLKKNYDSANVAVEALECPTMLYNGFGEHNIQGIGDKHIPLIHNVMNSDFAVAVSDQSTDELFVLFNSDAGREYLQSHQGVPSETVEQLHRLGLSGICNVLAAIKLAKYYALGSDDVIATVATDGAEMYRSEYDKVLAARYQGDFDLVCVAETFGQHLAGVSTDHLIELTHIDRLRIFNLGYFTWVEQQGVSLQAFEARRGQDFWHGLLDLVPAWDQMIGEFNQRTKLGEVA